MHKTLVAVILAASLGLTKAALYTSPADLPTDKQYHYVVVGAGVGGSVVANRLSQDPHTNVLLVEAGPRWASCSHRVLDRSANTPSAQRRRCVEDGSSLPWA